MDREQLRQLNQQMAQRIATAEPAPLVDGGYALRVVRTTGRTSGEPRDVPLAVIARDGRRYLVAPRARRDWVANLDAHPACSILGEDAPLTAVRRTDRTAALVALQYARTAHGPARSAFPFTPDALLDEVVAAMPEMAVFELVTTASTDPSTDSSAS
ncbi:nitroreductase/quinone reductase family protein [Pseudonocardia thermophila]|uniref:nitroreductase/quinone reductase family protein n=1 Tax=Pseudonocardia thermophila TaxID=1848 RepID=UPI00248EC78F|nr:nitroreductase/quinone reductase family protein [Pseudonocardia thermophila]